MFCGADLLYLINHIMSVLQVEENEMNLVFHCGLLCTSYVHVVLL